MSTTAELSPAAARLEPEYPWATPRELEAFAAANPPAMPVARRAADEAEAEPAERAA